MTITVIVQIDNLDKNEVVVALPDDMISLYLVEQFASEFIRDRLIMSGYPKKREKE